MTMTSVHTHRFPCGAAAVETTRAIRGISITECVGPLPDAFRTMHYGPVTHPEPPLDNGTSVAGFHEFLAALRDASEDAPVPGRGRTHSS